MYTNQLVYDHKSNSNMLGKWQINTHAEKVSLKDK